MDTDSLPQPYRRIQKILDEDIIGGLWRLIDVKEKLTAVYHGPLSAKEIHYVHPSLSLRYDDDPLNYIESNKEAGILIFAHKSSLISLYTSDSDSPLSAFESEYSTITWIKSSFINDKLYLLIGGINKENIQGFNILCYNKLANEWKTSALIQCNNVNGYLHKFCYYCIIIDKSKYYIYKININSDDFSIELTYLILPPLSIGITIEKPVEQPKEEVLDTPGRSAKSKTKPKTPTGRGKSKIKKEEPDSTIPVESYDCKIFPDPIIIINNLEFNKKRVDFYIFWIGQNILYKYEGINLEEINKEMKGIIYII